MHSSHQQTTLYKWPEPVRIYHVQVYNDPLVCTMIHHNKQLSTNLDSFQTLLSIILQRGASPSEESLGIVIDDKTKSLTTSTDLRGQEENFGFGALP